MCVGLGDGAVLLEREGEVGWVFGSCLVVGGPPVLVSVQGQGGGGRPGGRLPTHLLRRRPGRPPALQPAPQL